MKNLVISNTDIEIFSTPKQYKQQLLSLIANAHRRIYITALYLQDDEAGREILHALYKAKEIRPKLEINIFVDFHRGQRGLIGEKDSLGNRALYLDLAAHYDEKISIYGIAVKRKELFGVLHLKGMVFDDQLFYTGASINDIYMHQGCRYRLDRYYQIHCSSLTNSFCQYLRNTFINSNLAPLLNEPDLPSPIDQKRNILALKLLLKKSTYSINSTSNNKNSGVITNPISITPLIGFGRRKNHLNKVIRQTIRHAQKKLLIFTPYFNLPPVLAKDVVNALKRGVNITLVVGDKKANDFYIADESEFSTIGIVPYIYEMLLKRFVKRYQNFIDQGLLNIYLWQHEDNSFHLKGIISDERYHLLTGSNLNPRAWTLDLENGLLLDDPSKGLMTKVTPELVTIMEHTQKINHFSELDAVSDYPTKPKRLLNRIRIAQLDRILKRFL
ncbi:CDP-diacylglycerol--serine O-phosphatidyltransferase [Colwellia sp. 20A7]|uniref:CDP-diacylglycerol--serine O-phosphatidyltransferase n=1 Tax=Colwellia sp. 20A7 TaxID=2689569 RepID=UPI0013594EB9|nr:CDP-diacylglycerol--serine O-phosphatidyltransferase [Colwellia sp. 20A7]